MPFLSSFITTFAALPSQCDHSFFGIPPWYKYLPMQYEPANHACALDDSFKLLGNGSDSGLLLVGLALIEIGLRIAALVAIGYVLWGGFKFLTSQGEADAAAKARQTIMNALIGLVIAIFATAIVVFVGGKLAS